MTLPINTTLDSERIATLTRERDEARTEAARLMEEIQTCSGSCGHGLSGTSEAWLAEVRATARDEALEEAAAMADGSDDVSRRVAADVRALKRGDK